MKTEVRNLDIPIDDLDCWDRYPKFRWVYEKSRLFDAQSIHWSPVKTEAAMLPIASMQLVTTNPLQFKAGVIFVDFDCLDAQLAEAYIIKGEVKHIVHTAATNTGAIELRINAFVTMYFGKFTGVISVKATGNNIVSVRLMPSGEIESSQETDKLSKKIYKKIETPELI